MARILFYLDDFDPSPWVNALHEANGDLEVRVFPDWANIDDGVPTYAYVWAPPKGLLAQYPSIKYIFSLGAGVDHILRDTELPPHIPIVRMGDESLSEGMAEFFTMQVLYYHRRMPEIIRNQREALWKHVETPHPSKVRVGIMGYGRLGKAVAHALMPFGYALNTWSRSPKTYEEGITHFTGYEQMADFLSQSDILVCLLPSTPETRGLLDNEQLSHLPVGAAIINAGRGDLIDLDNLVKHLDNNHLTGATLDVFPKEPLDKNSPLWRHDKLIITPHIAAITRPGSAARYVAGNIARIEEGLEPENVMDRTSGY